MDGKFQIEPEVADAILDVGVSVPVKTFRLPFKKGPVQLRVTVRRPTMGSKLRIDRLYLSMGVTVAEYKAYSMEERIRFRAEQGKRLSRILAIGVCRGYIVGALFSGIVAWWLRWCVEDIYHEALFERFITLLGTQSFENTITLLEANCLLNQMNVSREEKGS
jgi:hypothetical protein